MRSTYAIDYLPSVLNTVGWVFWLVQTGPRYDLWRVWLDVKSYSTLLNLVVLPNYTAWWQRHTRGPFFFFGRARSDPVWPVLSPAAGEKERSLPKATVPRCPGRTQTLDLWFAISMSYQ